MISTVAFFGAMAKNTFHLDRKDEKHWQFHRNVKKLVFGRENRKNKQIFILLENTLFDRRTLPIVSSNENDWHHKLNIPLETKSICVVLKTKPKKKTRQRENSHIRKLKNNTKNVSHSSFIYPRNIQIKLIAVSLTVEAYIHQHQYVYQIHLTFIPNDMQ